tara:strand:+ start:222 stop:467 length:246 start_codon:yes stop_codon:yes gene_type:complete
MREGVLVLKRRIKKGKAKRDKLPAALKRSESAMSMGSVASDGSESGVSESGGDGGGDEEDDEEEEERDARHRERRNNNKGY